MRSARLGNAGWSGSGKSGRRPDGPRSDLRPPDRPRHPFGRFSRRHGRGGAYAHGEGGDGDEGECRRAAQGAERVGHVVASGVEGGAEGHSEYRGKRGGERPGYGKHGARGGPAERAVCRGGSGGRMVPCAKSRWRKVLRGGPGSMVDSRLIPRIGLTGGTPLWSASAALPGWAQGTQSREKVSWFAVRLSDRPSNPVDMRICLVTPYDLSHEGGVNRHVITLAHALRRQGHDLRILGPASGETPPRCDSLPGVVPVRAQRLAGARILGLRLVVDVIFLRFSACWDCRFVFSRLA